jgi:hypothetical protein
MRSKKGLERPPVGDYEKTFKDFIKSEQISELHLFGDETEPHFSHLACDCCGDVMAGNRHDVSAKSSADGKIHEYQICDDCLYYSTYGQLDDMTMAYIFDE